jgi:hypothetical protein
MPVPAAPEKAARKRVNRRKAGRNYNQMTNEKELT